MSPLVNSRIGTQVKVYQPDLINISDSSIGDGCVIGTFVEINGADMGERCELGSYVHITQKCKIGNDVKIGHNTVIMTGATVGSNVVIGAGCMIASNVHVSDNAIIDDNVCVTQDVKFAEHISKERPREPIDKVHPPSYTPRDLVFGGINPDPAISSDHPAKKLKDTKIEYRGGKPYFTSVVQATPGEPIQLQMEDLFKIESPGDISEFFDKARPCKGKCMEEPRSSDNDPLGFDFLK